MINILIIYSQIIKKKYFKKEIKEFENENLININKTTNKRNDFLNNHLYEKGQKIKQKNLNKNYKTETNNNRVSKFKNQQKYKNHLTIEEIKFSPKYEAKTKKADELKEYKIETIFNYPVKFINNKININNYFTNNKANFNLMKNNYRSTTNKIKKIPVNKKSNKIKTENKNKTNKIIKEKIANKINKGKNDTEIKYINNDNEDMTESNLENKYDKEKIVNINDDFDNYFKMEDSSNNEADDYYNEFSVKNKNNLRNDNFNQKITEIIFDDELSRISRHPKEKNKNKNNKNNKKNKIESPIKL